MLDTAADDTSNQQNGVLFKNLGDPIRLVDANLAGVSASAARPGDNVEIWTRLALTSDQAVFQKIVPNLASAIEHIAQSSGTGVKLDRAQMVLMVVHPDNTGELWLDKAATVTYTRLRRPGPLPAGAVLFEGDVADVTGIWFPLVDIGEKDRILCLFREGWRFGLYFDFNPDEKLDIDLATKSLGDLYRRMKYASLYAAVADTPNFSALVSLGWFPFLELMGAEYGALWEAYQAGFPLEESEQELVAKFDTARVDRIFCRWMEQPHLKPREEILRSAINAFKARDAVSVIKNLLSEIEGAMSDLHHAETNERTHRIGRLLEFVIRRAEQRAGGKDTLFFPAEFGLYLQNYTYAGFKPGDVRSAGSRHAVQHGAVPAEEYTMTRALQAILTLDQIAFYS